MTAEVLRHDHPGFVLLGMYSIVYVQRLNLDLDSPGCLQSSGPGIRLSGCLMAPVLLAHVETEGQNARWPGYFGATSALALAQVSLNNKLEQAQLSRPSKNLRECDSRIDSISLI